MDTELLDRIFAEQGLDLPQPAAPAPLPAAEREAAVPPEPEETDLDEDEEDSEETAGPWRRWRVWRAGLCLAVALLMFGVYLARVLPGSPWSRGRAVAGKRYQTKKIAEVVVGDRVLADNPLGQEDLSLGEEVDAATWRQVELRAAKADGSWAEVVLLRPQAWLQERGAQVGGTLLISVPECGIDGHAEVLRISACPPIRKGKGRVVIGTFKHTSARVLDLHIEGLDRPLGTTANHPFWSEDRQRFVAAGELRQGERLRATHGTARLRAAVPRRKPEAVYNVEVHGAHVYHVSRAGILVHNVGAKLPDSLTQKGGVYIFYVVDKKNSRVTGYVGSAFDFWVRLAGTNENLNQKHKNVIAQLGIDDVAVELYPLEGVPRSRGRYNSQEHLAAKQFTERWQQRGFDVKLTNDENSPPRSETPRSAYKKDNQNVPPAEYKARLEEYDRILKDPSKKALVDRLVELKLLSEAARDDPKLLSIFQADLLRDGDKLKTPLNAAETAEWLRQVRNARARQGDIPAKYLLPCPGR